MSPKTPTTRTNERAPGRGRSGSVASASTPLDADPNIDFGPFRAAQLADYQGTPERHLYYYLLHVDEHSEVLPRAFDLAITRLRQADQLAKELPDELNLRPG